MDNKTANSAKSPIKIDSLESTSAQDQFKQASMKTVGNLQSIAQSIMGLSQLTLPEVEAVVEEVARVIPAGNVPGVVLNGLARLPDRAPPAKTVKRDINLLFKGVQQALDKTVYGTVFAGPAAVIWGYQNLLKIAGKDPEDSFPEGTWQFYVDYAMREDTARHTNESHGFDSLLRQHNINLNSVDRITAWVMSAIHALHQYSELLANEWRERRYTYLLQEATRLESNAELYAGIYRAWIKQRPFARGQDVQGHETYAHYRQRKFYEFLGTVTEALSPRIQRKWQTLVADANQTELPAYQQQMSILGYLEPGANEETRCPIDLKSAHVGVIYQGRYYLIPACLSGTTTPPEIEVIRGYVDNMVNNPAQTAPPHLTQVATSQRADWSGLRKRLNSNLRQELDWLRHAPILLNCDQQGTDLPLVNLRQTERGVGGHALTLIDTGQTMIFDQSHIFFDGGWGATLAEIMTNEALAWAVYLSQLPPTANSQTPPLALSLQFEPSELERLKKLSQITPEVSAETQAIKLKQMLRLRRIFKQRSDLLNLTVNDILVLYRAIHGNTYQPNPKLITTLENLSQHHQMKPAAQEALKAIAEASQLNPVVVIPVDGSMRLPQDRLYPMTFEVPLAELSLLELHQQTLDALNAYKSGSGNRTQLFQEFNRLQRTYLATLAGFGAVLNKAKEIASVGEGASTGTIKLLAHMPTPLQRMLDEIPGRIDLLNDLIKGREVFSNVGAVAKSSTLTRFVTAKDDNNKKTLAWGIITTAQGVMTITLRDFRPHVGQLIAVGQTELAQQIVQDYLTTYAKGLNQFIVDLWRITETSRETHMPRERTADFMA
ncbi:choline/carnitine O-acyltransferase [Anaerolineales bacterium HSG25]|nr:choline/carnitine O-acyltransferase [Anaerolineales bacterium HSG25]